METIKAKTILQKTKSTEWFGTDYNMNLYRGCCHGCIYCDSRSECYRVEDFENVKYKENALQILRDELRRKVRSGIVGTGAMSDPYNPLEEKLLLTRHSFELIDAFEFGCMVLSKSALITRDKDIFASIKEHSPVICAMTITSADDELSRMTEPNVSVSSERLSALAELSASGLFTGIVMMPILPFIGDTKENIVGIVQRGAEAGVRFIYPSLGVTMRKGQREYFLEKLNELFPEKELGKRYASAYGDSYYCSCKNASSLWDHFTAECGKYGILYKMQDIICASKLGYKSSQLSFFE